MRQCHRGTPTHRTPSPHGVGATARLGGLAPQIGLFAFVAASLGFVAFGANRRMSIGADSTITPIFAGSLAGLAMVGASLVVDRTRRIPERERASGSEPLQVTTLRPARTTT